MLAEDRVVLAAKRLHPGHLNKGLRKMQFSCTPSSCRKSLLLGKYYLPISCLRTVRMFLHELAITLCTIT